MQNNLVVLAGQLGSLVQDAITEYLRLGGLEQHQLVSQSWRLRAGHQQCRFW